jgi:hypothetical protein
LWSLRIHTTKKGTRKPISGALKNILIGELFKCIHQNRYSILDVSESSRHVVWVSLLALGRSEPDEKQENAAGIATLF